MKKIYRPTTPFSMSQNQELESSKGKLSINFTIVYTELNKRYTRCQNNLSKYPQATKRQDTVKVVEVLHGSS
jgi:hypothetical protein